ncbi:TPR-containing protein DDB_G0280363 isoform X2 [Aphidius gifuensis]|uniref:TPR-containing protein DDB_G0280363 isoform X2 n=1 Tax=Aphidius gifuensis TaxID=684658 RepID=UPI001CDD6F3B|nr:TPR-containing protein DDB_G0280363 isoform X2 [Aphidius gifuensis]
MLVELRSKRPFKIWDSWRNVRKGLVVSNFEELLHRGKEKLGVPSVENVSLVLESDGTQVEDGEYFKTLSNNTILLLLRHGERWCPTGVDIIRAAISAIPKIVCETIHALELHDETPSWKIMDNKGRVTVVLHWDQRTNNTQNSQQQQQQNNSQNQQYSQQQQTVQQSKNDTSISGTKYSPIKKSELLNQRPSLVIETSIDKIAYGKTTTTTTNNIINNDLLQQRYSSPQITVINHDDMIQKNFINPTINNGNGTYGSIITSSSSSPGQQQLLREQQQQQQHGGMTGRLVKQGTNSFESTTIHIHTPECSGRIHQPVRNGSPVNGTDGGQSECDFHCCALHEEGRRIAVHKSVATSPIQDPHLIQQREQQQQQQQQQQTQTQTPSPQPPSSLSDGTRRSGNNKGHVRFRDTTDDESSSRNTNFHMHHHNNHHQEQLQQQQSQQHDSSESETENTIMEDEVITSEKFLLLIDQLTVDQKHHLSIKDIGIILERLRPKILDVERLDRESESEECYNWTIKAIIRGDVLRDFGVLYNGNYYAISEHPGYKEESEENNEDNEEEEEEEEEEEDRL